MKLLTPPSPSNNIATKLFFKASSVGDSVIHPIISIFYEGFVLYLNYNISCIRTYIPNVEIDIPVIILMRCIMSVRERKVLL